MTIKEMTVNTKKEITLVQLLARLWVFHLNSKRKNQLKLTFVLMVISSLSEIISLSSVFPFLAVLTNPENFWQKSNLFKYAPLIGINSSSDLLLPLTILFVFAAIISGFIRILNIWLNGRLAASIGSELSSEAYKRTLYQPYSVHLASNSSEIISSISRDVDRVSTWIIYPLLQMFSSSLIALGLVSTLLFLNWSIALTTGLLIFLVYGIAIALIRKPSKRISSSLVQLHLKLIQTLQESLGAIRDVILGDTQKIYTKIFSKTDKNMRVYEAKAVFLSSYPRLLLEPLSISFIAILGYVLVKTGGIESAIPMLGALALASIRLMPMVQKIYEAWTMSRNAKESLRNLVQLLERKLPQENLSRTPLGLRQSINFCNVGFKYGKSLPYVINNLNLIIEKGDCIGLTGKTGGGKSTTLDLLMGLIKPTYGKILVDDLDINNSEKPQILNSWRSSIIHVPQTIFLADTTILENIAFGVSPEFIDIKRVIHAAELAQIHSFIDSSPEKYSTRVGERGIRLSGGQRQRIGIARALYKDVDVLVLDEATSALDDDTEEAVMSALSSFNKNLTIIMIAHRIRSLNRCNKLFELKDGKLTVK